MGQDIICWKHDELGDVELAVAQIKLYKPSARASGDKAFAGLVNQLQQAAEHSVQHPNGHAYHPRTVYCITPFELSTRALQSRCEGYTALRQSCVKVLDGTMLAAMVVKYLPDLAGSLCGPGWDISRVALRELKNIDLLRALRVAPNRQMETFYTDLDLSLGKMSQRVFLGAKFASKDSEYVVTQAEVPLFQKLSKDCAEVMGVELCTKAGDNLVANLRNKVLRREEDLKRKTQLVSQIGSLRNELLRRRLPLPSKEASVSIPQTLVPTFRWLVDSLDQLVQIVEMPGKVAIELPQVKRGIESRLAKLDQLAGVLNYGAGRERELAATARDVIRIAEKILPLATELGGLRGLDEQIVQRMQLNTHELEKSFRRQRFWILSTIARFNKAKPTTKELRQFIVKATRVLDVGSRLLRDSRIAEALGVAGDTRFVRDVNRYRLRVSIGDIFHTGEHCIVLGEAGAGKTTSLQMYARANSDDTGRPCLFVPLGRLLSIAAVMDPKSPSVPRLIGAIAAWYRSLGARLADSDLDRLLKDRGGTLLLDGLDEVVRSLPWIIDAITGIPAQYPRVQVITTSRTAGDYVEQLPFLSLTLLPFTVVQRNYFVRQWCNASEEKASAKEILAHLKDHTDLSEIVRNPLLATLLCTLQEHKVPLPTNEIRLYEERLNLLLGQYDIARGTARLQCSLHDLSLVAAFVGFSLHQRERREASIEEIQAIAKDMGDWTISPSVRKRAVEELVYPCNVLVPMTDDGKIGFGHLRFQEYCAAVHLSRDRSVQLDRLAVCEWWRGAFSLVAKMLSDVGWLVGELSASLERTRCEKTIQAIIAARPSEEQRALRYLLRETEAMESELA